MGALPAAMVPASGVGRAPAFGGRLLDEAYRVQFLGRAMIAFIRPVWQAIAIAMVLVALRQGMGIRRARLRESGVPRPPARRRHVAVGLASLALLAIGEVIGAATMHWARHEPVFRTWHAWIGTAAVGLFALGGWYGLRLKSSMTGRPPREEAAFRGLHVFCVGVALFLALVEVVVGLPLLP